MAETAAGRFARSFVPAENVRAGDLVVLALERALVRDGTVFVDPGTMDEFAADAPCSDRPLGTKDPSVVAGCSHVADWIVSACLNDAAWLRRTDDRGRPLKLMKIGSLARAVHEADKDMRRFAAGTASVRLVEGEESLEADIGEGWSLVRLLTPTALDRESSRMQHCIGQGSYDAKLADEAASFLSLRDPAGSPHATLELVRPWNSQPRVAQFQGKQNQRPQERHVRRLRGWLRENAETSPTRGRSPEWWSAYVLSEAGERIDLMDPPARVRTASAVKLHLMEGDVLPTEILQASHIELTIDPSRRSPVVLPVEMRSSGKTVLSGRGAFVFGRTFYAQSLATHGCRLEGIGPGFRVHERTTMADTSVDVVPAGARLGPTIATGCDIRFGTGFSSKAMRLSETVVGELPEDFHAEALHVVGCPPFDIPDGSRIGFLSVLGRGVSRIGRIEGLATLELDDVPADTTLPNEMSVSGDMRIRGPGFPSVLPGKLHVGGELHVDRTPGLVLPTDLDIGRLLIEGSSVEALPDGTRIRGSLELVGTQGIAVGVGCEIVDIGVLGPEETRTPGKIDLVTVDFDPSISWIGPDGSIRTRDPKP